MFQAKCYMLIYRHNTQYSKLKSCDGCHSFISQQACIDYYSGIIVSSPLSFYFEPFLLFYIFLDQHTQSVPLRLDLA